MSKTPEKLAKKYVDKHALTGTGAIEKKCFLAGYKAAQAIVEEELQAVQAQRAERPGLGSAEYALKRVLAKMGLK